MGTLTAGQPRLDAYCDHKLPTSCRLTSIPECCACADERAHSAAYSTYIDGVGFVQRGIRWQRYCWFCKEFWENRVRASGLRSGQTRVPEEPDQTAFLDRWYEFHRGYRTVTKDDGSEERVAVLGEDFREVSPGYLPRTLEELRSGSGPNLMLSQQQRELQGQEQEAIGPSLEETLDQMFQEAAVEGSEQTQPAPAQREPTRTTQSASELAYHQMLDDNARQVMGDDAWRRGREAMEERRSADAAHRARVEQAHLTQLHAQAMVPAGSRNREYQARRVAALRRELHRMRNGIERVISGLQDLGETVPNHTEATGRLAELGRSLDAIDGAPSREDAERAITSVNALAQDPNPSQSDRTLASIQGRVSEARQHLDEARRNRDQAASELDLAEQELRTSQQRLQQLQREQRTTENYLRLFGTREEMLAQGDQYESPIGSMFTRAYERFRAAEEVRVEERTLRRVLEDEARGGGEESARRLAELEDRESDVWGVPRPSQQPPQDVQLAENEGDPAEEPRGELEEYYAMLRRQDRTQQVPPPVSLDRATTDDVRDSRSPETSATRSDASPQNMLNAAVTTTRSPPASEALESPSDEVAELPGSDPSLSSNQEWRSDVEHILLHLVQDFDLSMTYMMTPDYLQVLLSRVTDDRLTDNDRRELHELLTTPEVVWSSSLPAARIIRSRRAGVPPVLLPSIAENDFQQRCNNIEVMAEVFQRSAEVRRRAPQLSAPEQLRMLYRLQAGERRLDDVSRLGEMHADQQTFRLASRIHEQVIDNEHTGFHNARRLSLEAQRRSAARQGNHSRQELDAQRAATLAFATAAGRTAMAASAATRVGPSTTSLVERLASRDEETRAAYNRLQANGYVPDGDSPAERLLRETIYRPLNLADYGDVASPTESEAEEEEEDEAQGLDAKDSGRPEAQTDEQMTVSMECRICYTQLAEIACLPCGHLVMCKWCAEQHSPVMAHDRTRPRRAAGCPVCRKGIRQKVRVFRA